MGTKQQAITRKAKEALDGLFEKESQQESQKYGVSAGRQIAGDKSQWTELVAESTAETSFVMTT